MVGTDLVGQRAHFLAIRVDWQQRAISWKIRMSYFPLEHAIKCTFTPLWDEALSYCLCTECKKWPLAYKSCQQNDCVWLLIFSTGSARFEIAWWFVFSSWQHYSTLVFPLWQMHRNDPIIKILQISNEIRSFLHLFRILSNSFEQGSLIRYIILNDFFFKITLLNVQSLMQLNIEYTAAHFIQN